MRSCCKLAAEGKLREQLDAQIDRMLASPRADQLIRNFGEQWLETRKLETLRAQRRAVSRLRRRAARRPSARKPSCSCGRRSQRPAADDAAVGRLQLRQRAARQALRHRAEPTGDEFVRVELPRRTPRRHPGTRQRAGGHGVRGPHLAGAPRQMGARPPAGRPAAAPAAGRAAVCPTATGDLAHKSLRERLEIHRANPSCAVCHKRMDPLGLAMENFDAVGRWRENDGERPDRRQRRTARRAEVHRARRAARRAAGRFPRVRAVHGREAVNLRVWAAGWSRTTIVRSTRSSRPPRPTATRFRAWSGDRAERCVQTSDAGSDYDASSSPE